LATESGSFCYPLVGLVVDFFNHVDVLSKNGAKLLSRERMYMRLLLSHFSLTAIAWDLFEKRKYKVLVVQELDGISIVYVLQVERKGCCSSIEYYFFYC